MDRSQVRELKQQLGSALQRRTGLVSEDNDCYRMVNGPGDGLPGVTVDRFGPLALLSFYESVTQEVVDAWRDELGELLDGRSLYVKHRPRTARDSARSLEALAPKRPVLGPEVPEAVVRERGLQFLIRPGEGLAVGLYLDAREARALVEKQSRGARVLNLFAYTGAFGVAARRGGASRVLNVDLSQHALEWAQENARLNGQPANPGDHLARDVFESLRRLAKRGEQFELVISDPPSFSSSRKGVFSVERDMARLAAAAAGVVAPGGTLVALCNQASLSAKAFEGRLRDGVAQMGRRVTRLERSGASSLDFPPAPGQEPPLKVLSLSLS